MNQIAESISQAVISFRNRTGSAPRDIALGRTEFEQFDKARLIWRDVTRNNQPMLLGYRIHVMPADSLIIVGEFEA